jgi:G6PDH family F420-dependent oxidoreductase
MPSFGFTLMGEQFAPEELVRNARLAEEAGFGFAAFSDHFHPWLEAQGQSPFAWSVLGAVAERTERLRLMTMVTCPTLRYHPAIVAQAAATVQRLSGGRFTLGVGAGEQLNEHVVGRPWPPADVRQEMLEEAVEIMRLLFAGGFQRFRGRHLTLQDARLYSLPDQPVTIALAAGGTQAAELAGLIGDGLIATEPEASYIDAFRGAGGAGRPTYGQVALCWHEDEAQARRIARERWRFALPGWKVMAELPNPVNFEAATELAREDDVADLVACGPDPEVHVTAIQRFLDAGYENVAVVQASPDQAGFLRFWERELAPRLAGRAVSA